MRLPSQGSQILSDQYPEPAPAHAHVCIQQLIRLFDQERLAVGRLEVQQVVGNFLKPVQGVVFGMGEVHVGLEAAMAHQKKDHVEADQQDGVIQKEIRVVED